MEQVVVNVTSAETNVATALLAPMAANRLMELLQKAGATVSGYAGDNIDLSVENYLAFGAMALVVPSPFAYSGCTYSFHPFAGDMGAFAKVIDYFRKLFELTEETVGS